MAHPLQAAFEMYTEKLTRLLDEVTNTKRMLNDLAKEMGMTPPYADLKIEGVSVLLDIKPGQFFGKAPMRILGELLDMRGREKGAMRWDEIWQAFQRGEYKGKKEENVKDTLKKNTAAFKYFSKTDTFGKKEWYPNDEKEPQNGKEKKTGGKKKVKVVKMVEVVKISSQVKPPRGKRNPNPEPFQAQNAENGKGTKNPE